MTPWVECCAAVDRVYRWGLPDPWPSTLFPRRGDLGSGPDTKPDTSLHCNNEWNLSSLFRWTCCGNTSWSYHNKFLTVFDVLEHWYVTEEVTSSNRIKKSVRSYVIEYVYKNICKQLIFQGFLQVDINYMILPSWNQFLCKDTVQEFPCGSVN